MACQNGLGNDKLVWSRHPITQARQGCLGTAIPNRDPYSALVGWSTGGRIISEYANMRRQEVATRGRPSKMEKVSTDDHEHDGTTMCVCLFASMSVCARAREFHHTLDHNKHSNHRHRLLKTSLSREHTIKLSLAAKHSRQ